MAPKTTTPKKKFIGIDFDKLNFQINWASGTVIVGLLVGIITLYITNTNLESTVESQGETITSQGKTIETLSGTVNTLQGSTQVISNAMQQIIANPPGELRYRLDLVERRLGINPEQIPSVPFENKPPSN